MNHPSNAEQKRSQYLKTKTVRNSALVFVFLSSFVLLSCLKRKTTQSDPTSMDDVFLESRDYVRNVHLTMDSQFSAEPLDASILFQDGSLSAVNDVQEFQVSRSEYSSITAMQSSLWPEKTQKHLKLEKINVHKSIPPVTVRAAGRMLGLQLNFSSKSSIKIYRHFDSEGAAQNVRPFEFVDLPVTPEKVDAMRTGDLVVIPIEGQLMTGVDGSFFRNVYAVGKVIDSLLGSSLIGQAQTGLRANMIVQGKFEMHIMKTDAHSVRLRIFQQDQRSFSSGAAATASVAANVKVIPFSKIQQIGEIKKATKVRLNDGTFKVPQILQSLISSKVLKGTTQSYAEQSEKFSQEARRRPDQLLELSGRINLDPKQIQNQTIARMSAVMEKFDPNFSLRIRKTSDAIKFYSDQELRFDAGVSWSEARTGKQQFYADYSFDLRDEKAREAYLMAVSGGAAVLSARLDLSKYISQSQPLHNLLLADRIAQDEVGQSSPSVVRWLAASARSEINEGQFAIHFGKQMSFALSESWLRENYRLSRGSGSDVQQGALTRWNFRQSTFFGLVGEKRERSSGFMTDALSAPGQQSLYWYSQAVDTKTPGQSHLSQFLVQAFNVLGPAAGSLGVDRLYSGDAEGRFRGRIVIGLAESLLDTLFDASKVTEERVWRAVADVSASFDNTFGLPFLVIPAGVPAEVWGTPNEAHCQRVSSHWGSFYCHFLTQEFMPRLRKAQELRTVEAKGEFLEAFFARGFGANKIGSDMLARTLLQIALDVKGQLDPSELVVLLEGRNQSSSAAEFNPRVSYGNSELIRSLEETLPVW